MFNYKTFQSILWKLIFFLVPLLYFPIFLDASDYPKHKIFILGFCGVLLVSLFREFNKQKTAIGWNWLITLLCIFLISFLLSSIFSSFFVGSFLGSASIVLDYFLLFFFFVIFSLTLAYHFKANEFVSLLKAFLLGVTIAEAITLVFYFQFFKHRTFLPLFFGKLTTAPLIASLLLPFVLLLFISAKTKKDKIFYCLILLVFFAALIVFNFRLAWILTCLFSVILIAFVLPIIEKTSTKMVFGSLCLLLTTLSIVFLFLPFRIAPALPLEASPSFATEYYILKHVLNQGVKNLFIGQGPGTFVFAYSLYKPSSLNKTVFWGTRFTSGSATMLDWFITKGILGGVILFALFIASIVILFSRLKNTSSQEQLLNIGFLLLLIGLFILSFIYVFPFVLWFLFWFAIGFVLTQSKTKEVKLPSSFLAKRGIAILNALLIVGILLVMLLQFQQLLSNYYVRLALNKSNQGDIDESLQYLERATKIYSLDDFYWRNLAQAYLLKADELSRNVNIPQEQRQDAVGRFVKNGQKALEKALKLSPSNVANWNIAGYFYRNLIGVPGAGEIALSAYRKAIGLEPTSPFSYTELARVYILMAQDFAKKNDSKAQKEALSLAIVNLDKALKLKPDYSPALYLEAVAYDQKGEIEKAINFLEKTSQVAPQDAGVWFQLGMLYWRKEDLQKAKNSFEKAIQLKNDYSDALYMLGLVYDKLGNQRKAIELFEKVAQLNPNNQEVQKILDNLYNNKPALSGIIREEKPLYEKESEVGKEF